MTKKCLIPHEEEEINRRSLWLRLVRELWLVPAAAAAGALLAALLYMGIWLNVSGQRQYRQISKFYLTFGQDEAGNPQDYYNAYTWNDLLFSVPAIYQVIDAELPEDVTMETAREDVEALILSDVRVLTIQVTDADAQTVQALTNAVQDALVRYGSNAEEFRRIEFLSSDEVTPVVVTDRTRSAVVLGILLGTLAGAAFLWLREVLNDGVCTPEEAAARYHRPVLLTLGEERAGRGLPEFLERENCAFAGRNREKAALRGEAVPALRLVGADAALVQQTAERLMERYGLRTEAVSAGELLAEESYTEEVSAEEPSEEKPSAEGLRAGKRTGAGQELLLVVPFGRRNDTGTEHLAVQLQARGCTVSGLVLAGADPVFLQRYYGPGQEPSGKHL